MKSVLVLALVVYLGCVLQVESNSIPSLGNVQENDTDGGDLANQRACYQHINDDFKQITIPESVDKLGFYIRQLNHISLRGGPLKKILDTPYSEVKVINSGFLSNKEKIQETQQACASYITQMINRKSDAAEVCQGQVSNLFDLIGLFNFNTNMDFDRDAESYPYLANTLGFAQACLIFE